jgi:hypothetical protein
VSSHTFRDVTHWEIWRRHNDWENPTFCYACLGALDYEVRSTHSLAPVIHHINEDKSDNSYANLVPLHHGCHVRHHLKNGEAQRRASLVNHDSPEYRDAQKKAASIRMSTKEGRASLIKAQAAAQSDEANEKRRESCRAAAIARYAK